MHFKTVVPKYKSLHTFMHYIRQGGQTTFLNNLAENNDIYVITDNKEDAVKLYGGKKNVFSATNLPVGLQRKPCLLDGHLVLNVLNALQNAEEQLNAEISNNIRLASELHLTEAKLHNQTIQLARKSKHIKRLSMLLVLAFSLIFLALFL